MDMCILCYENMDMISYRDERENTSTCYKLDCGHAYHTACIIGCLTQMNRKCPQCNTEKDPSKELTKQGLAEKLLREIRNDEQVKPLINEFKEIKDEYSESIIQLKNDIREYAKKRADELCIPNKRKYIMTCLSKVQTTAKNVAKQKGSQYSGALKESKDTHRRWWRGTTFDQIFFGKQTSYSIYRLKYPHLSLNLF